MFARSAPALAIHPPEPAQPFDWTLPPAGGSQPRHSLPRATPDSSAAEAPLALPCPMSHAALFPRRSIAGFGFPPSVRLPLISRQAESPPAALFPEDCSDRRRPDRTHPCLRSLGRSQSPLAAPGYPPCPTRRFEREMWP